MWRLFWFTVGLVVLLAVLFSIIFGGHKAPKPATLTDTDFDNATLVYTIEGPVNARENHDSIKISISANGREFDMLNTYEYKVVNKKNYDNTPAAFDALRQALKTYGFMSQNKNSTDTSIYAVCPEGFRYVYQIIDGSGQEVYRTWSTSCGNTKVTTFAGSPAVVRQLFVDQIPDYNTLSEGFALY